MLVSYLWRVQSAKPYPSCSRVSHRRDLVWIDQPQTRIQYAKCLPCANAFSLNHKHINKRQMAVRPDLMIMLWMCAVCSVHFQIQPVAKTISSFLIDKPWTNKDSRDIWKSRNWKQNQSQQATHRIPLLYKAGRKAWPAQGTILSILMCLVIIQLSNPYGTGFMNHMFCMYCLTITILRSRF